MLRRLACAAVFVPSLAVAQDAQQGHEIAQRWCSSCHAVDRAATRAPADGLPTFPAIAAKPDLSADYLRAAMNPQRLAQLLEQNVASNAVVTKVPAFVSV